MGECDLQADDAAAGSLLSAHPPSHILPARQSGGMPGISLARQAGGPNPNVSALVFARWISLCYITLAQLRVVFPGGRGRLGMVQGVYGSGCTGAVCLRL